MKSTFYYERIDEVMLLVRQSTTKEYNYDEKGNLVSTIIKEIEKYHYRDEEEKFEHKNKMEKAGFKDSGQIKRNISTIGNPIYVWFGTYYRYEKIVI